MIDLVLITQQAIQGLGYEVLEVERVQMGNLQVTIDKPEGITIDDCEQVSRILTRVYEVENIDYNRLEVSSPGLDRPLRSEADFVRFQGERVEIKLRKAYQNRKVFSGVLEQVDPETVDVDHIAQTDETLFMLVLDAPKSPKKGKASKVAVAEPQALFFTFSDVEKAKLNPILDFKGKKNES